MNKENPRHDKRPGKRLEQGTTGGWLPLSLLGLILLLLGLLLLPACNSDGEDSSVDGDLTDGDATDGDDPDGDTQEDGDEETSDGDETDGDNPLPDGDEDGDDTDGDSEDTEDDVEQVDTESEAEGLYHVIDSDPVDGDMELGEGCEDWETPELGEDEEAPQWQLTSLWRESEIVPCSEEIYGELPSSPPWQIWGSNEGWALAAWSDGADMVLFGDEQGLWRYEENPTPTLRCDPTTPGTVYTLQGTGTGSSAVVWAGLTGQVARLENNEWTVETLPAPLTGPVLALAVDGSHIAAQTLEGVAVRKESGWEPVTGCEVFGIAFPEGVAVEQHQAAATGLLWQDGKLYVGATGTLVEIDPVAHTCKALCMDLSMEDNEEIRFAVQGKAGCGIWVMTGDPAVRICGFNGTWQASFNPPSIGLGMDSQGLTAKGMEDRWVYAAYRFGINQMECMDLNLIGWFDHTITVRPPYIGTAADLVDLGSFYFATTPMCTAYWTPPIRPAQLFVTGNVGYYSPGFSKVTFGE